MFVYIACANLLAMRFLVFALILSIFVSGYSAAAHVFGPDSCNSAAQEKIVDQSVDKAKCPSHQADQGQQKDTEQNKKAAAETCLSCTHCCASHAIGLYDYSAFDFQQPDTILHPPLVDVVTGDFLFSLLRPPKSLV